MRDVIWTIIVIWIVWKLYDAFTSFSRTKARSTVNPYGHSQQQQAYQQNSRREGEVKIENKGESKSHFKPDDGEYVDYEEIR